MRRGPIDSEQFLYCLFRGFRSDLLEIFYHMTTSTWTSMDDLEPPEEESEAMKGIRAWRATERKKMVESMEKLLGQAQKLALSQYTRSAERSKWTRLAGQLLWYKDQILRGMAWEALEQDLNKLTRDAYNDRHKQQRQRPTWQPITPAPFAPTIVKRREEEQDVEENPGNTVPEIMREEEGVDGKASSDPDPSVPTLAKKREKDEEV